MVKGRVIAVIAGCAAFAVAPACALAQGGFTDYRQAAADQYPQQPPPHANPPPNPPPDNPPAGTPGGDPSTGGSSGAPRPAGTPGAGHHGSGSQDAGGIQSYRAAGAAPVAVPTHAVQVAKGSLPFTGSDLSGLVVLALALVAAGFLLAAVERATRRRRAPA